MLLIVPAMTEVRKLLKRYPPIPPSTPPTVPRKEISARKAKMMSFRVAPRLRRTPASRLRLTTANIAVL
jgi:hypothetical protein